MALFNIPRTTSSYPLRQSSFAIPRSKFSFSTLNENVEAGDNEDEKYREPAKRPPPPDLLDRLLQEIPTRSTSLERGTHSRESSTVSNAVSVTPSLRSYFDRNTASPEPPFIGVATVMNVVASTFGLMDDSEKKDRGMRSSEEPYYSALSDHEELPTTPAKRPIGRVFGLSNITLRKHRRSSPTKPLSPSKQSAVRDSETSQLLEEGENAGYEEDEGNIADVEAFILDNTTITLSIPESEWMVRTPSPLFDDPERDKVERLWSPDPEKYSFRNSFNRTIKAAKVSIDVANELEDRRLLAEDQDNGGVNMRSGNWI